MNRTIGIGTAIGVLMLAGCGNNQALKDLKNAQQAMSNEVVKLRERVKTVEEAYLQLHDRLNGGGNGRAAPEDEESSSPSASASMPRAPATTGAGVPDIIPLGNFADSVHSMARAAVLKKFGAPDRVSKLTDSESWTYNQVSLQKDDGSIVRKSVMVVFDKEEQVIRGVVLENIQYESQPAVKTETPAAAAPANQTPESQTSVPTPAAADEQQAPAAPASTGAAVPDKIPLGNFDDSVTGMKPEAVTEKFGQPDQVNKTDNDETWTYNQVSLQKDDGSMVQMPVKLVLAGGRVVRGDVIRNIPPSTPPAATQSTNTAAQNK